MDPAYPVLTAAKSFPRAPADHPFLMFGARLTAWRESFDTVPAA